MSYLDRPGIHFFGKFFANPSTIRPMPMTGDLSASRRALVEAWITNGGPH
jgi:hypothetical protein